jgi:hypothetical protein
MSRALRTSSSFCRTATLTDSPALSPSRRAKRPNGEWGRSNRCDMLGRECQEAVLPHRALYLPTASHLMTPLSLSLFHTHSLPPISGLT